jgi:hypothetical protein
MAHRTFNGRIDDLEAARAEWREQNRTVSTFCSKAEWEAWQEDFGDLVQVFDDGFEVRQHATIKATSRGGSRKIVHNCVIEGNPAAYARWKADDRPQLDKGWYPQWTYLPCRELADLSWLTYFALCQELVDRPKWT